MSPYLGTWELDPSRSQYERGEPPPRGIYRISRSDRGLRFDVEWTDQEDEPRTLSFDLSFRETTNVDGAMVDMRLDDADGLVTEVSAGAAVVARATRVLEDDGAVLAVTQSGPDPAGGTFANRSWYRRG